MRPTELTLRGLILGSLFTLVFTAAGIAELVAGAVNAAAHARDDEAIYFLIAPQGLARGFRAWRVTGERELVAQPLHIFARSASVK
jgi:hypothetical protein